MQAFYTPSWGACVKSLFETHHASSVFANWGGGGGGVGGSGFSKAGILASILAGATSKTHPTRRQGRRISREP